MTTCCSFGQTADEQFTRQKATQELRRFVRKGPGVTTRHLRDGLLASGLREGTLLDVGAGIGALTMELFAHGITAAVAVDASAAYVALASQEVARRGHARAVKVVHGDFLIVGPSIPPATVVALDRVICCYPLFRPLIEEATRHAVDYVALSYPKDRWYVRAVIRVENIARRVKGKAFRTYLHPGRDVEAVMSAAGFALTTRQDTVIWRADVYTAHASPSGVSSSHGHASSMAR